MNACVTRLRAKLDEVAVAHWSTAQLQQWVFDGAKDAARKSECNRDTYVGIAVPGTQSYALTTSGIKDLIRITRVTYQQVGQTEQFPLDYADFNSYDSMSWATDSRSRPDIYATWGFPPNLTLVLYPAPSDAGNIRIDYYRLPSANVLTDPTQVVELPQGWEDLAIDYAVYQALLQDGDARWQQYKAIYDEHLADLTATAIRFNDQAGMMNVGAGGAVPQWLWDEGWGG